MMTASENASCESSQLIDQVAEALLAHPSVVRLDGGEFGVIASYLPHRQVTGVRIGADGELVEVAVVLRLDRPLPEIVAELRQRVEVLTGTVPLDITVSDVVAGTGEGTGADERTEAEERIGSQEQQE